MGKIIIFICLVFSFVFTDYTEAQNEEKIILFQRFLKQYNAGDLVNAERSLLLFLDSKVPLTEGQLISVYNNLGVIYTSLGRYKDALDYYSKAEAVISDEHQNLLDLADILINKAIIFGNQKSYNSSIEYFEKGIRIYLDIKDPDKSVYYRISTAYLNVGIIYYEIKDYKTALRYLQKSSEIKQHNQLSEVAFVLLNIAKTYVGLKSFADADKFFQRSIKSCNKEFGENYFKLAEIYFGYGLFLQSVGRNAEAIEIHKKALSICLNYYGDKHAFVSLSYKHIGDDYMYKNKTDSALYYYQESLIAVDRTFSNTDIFTNPVIDSSLFDIRLLDNLKSKALALDLFTGEQKDPEMKLKLTAKSLETVELALQLIERIRNDYMSEESRIYLAENEKETYLFATHLAYSLYSLTHDVSTGNKMYGIAQKAKAAILRNEITGNELLYSAGMPDSLREKQNSLNGNIAAYNNLVLEENRKTKPDSNKIALWKDALFDMNREKEKVTTDIESAFPQFHDLIRKTEPVSLQMIQKQLKNNETIVDYLLSNQYSDGKRKLYIFLISNNSLAFREQFLDSIFVRNAEIIRSTSNPSMAAGSQNDSFKNYTGALNYMYLNLIKPVEAILKGNKLIIIPDEEIGWLPFDAFLKRLPGPDQTDYEGLGYLVNDYTFSYGYSSSLISGKKRWNVRGTKVFAFSPDYHDAGIGGKKLPSLQGAGAEIGSVFKWFKGMGYTGENATKGNFLSVLNDPAILHLAMHSMTDSTNTKYSYLMFDTHNLSQEQGKLYNYEISLTRIKSPMVVLSACNSGTGTLYSGEGLMSLARGFILAGASSVIKTAWEINDETSTEIITHFYYHLSKGKEKDQAMHLAKLEYLKSSSPAFKNPYYWAAYEVLGDNARVARNLVSRGVLISLVVLIAAGLAVFYFNRRKIFSDRSL